MTLLPDRATPEMCPFAFMAAQSRAANDCEISSAFIEIKKFYS